MGRVDGLVGIVHGPEGFRSEWSEFACSASESNFWNTSTFDRRRRMKKGFGRFHVDIFSDEIHFNELEPRNGC